MARWNWLLPRWSLTAALVFVVLVRIPVSVANLHSTVDEPPVALGTLFTSAPVGANNNDDADAPPGTEDQALMEIEGILSSIPTGQEALSIKDKYHVGVKREGTASYYVAPSNSIVISSEHGPVAAALVLVHEMTHVKYHHEGLFADAKTLLREAYIARCVGEETEAHVKSIHAWTELEAAGVDLSYTLYYPFAIEYRMYFEMAIESAKKESPTMPEDELERIGREAGKAQVFKRFMQGWVKTSTTEEAYPDYCVRDWDAYHNSQQ